ncbi:late embryogenesis abundant protein At1g64065 [Ricinus communis]|uniref:Late embryogenesis abundant protein LEA-2 subgroup domain-containing protein n=1 Tax=Ricinus communis TaxID=3988 RepID=B9RCI8_RICCO|nr:late embryogenesis abundant protein At1g64065 [Ricinus communis]EEF51259.1 conserved hypothetical protein [Ricinus communis]|eukprot:XP_002509872.1 late embryogenesis abundant protein At1g64065 [Ricinus communis]
MVEDNQIVPLAPAETNPRSDEEFAAVKPNLRLQERSSKCLVYVLAGIVILSAVILVFALVVLRPVNPNAELSFVRLKDLNYAAGSGGNGNNVSLPAFNMTLESELKIENSNFGEFKYDNTSARVFYGGMAVGEAILREGRVSARDTLRMNVKVEVRSHKYIYNGTDLTSDINSGILKLNSHAKFSGRVNLLQIAKKRRSASMDCSFSLDLRSRSIQDLVCN